MKNAIYNPNDQPEHMLPVIYGFNNGGSPGFRYWPGASTRLSMRRLDRC